MLVQVIGNAPPSQFATPPKKASEAPVLRDKVFGLPVDRDVLFTNERNIYHSRIEQRQRKLIVKLAFLKHFLLAGERILRIIPARSPLRWYEQILTGGVFIGLENALLVFTSYRILHIPTGSDYSYRQTVAQIRYRDIRSIRLRWQTLIVKYNNGRTERFGGIAFHERKKVRQLLAALPLTKQVLQPVGRRHLCPRCAAVLSEQTMRCRRCELPFKTKPVAACLALLFPGGAYLYARLFFPGVVFFILEALLLTTFAAVFTSYIPIGAHQPIVLGVTVLALAAVKAVGWIHAGHFLRQYIPSKSRVGRWSPADSGSAPLS